MAQKLQEKVSLSHGGRRTYTQIPWAKYADGEQWELKRADWLTAKSATHVLDMARRYADRKDYVLMADRAGEDAVIVQLVSHRSILNGLHAGHSAARVAEHYGVPVEAVEDVIAKHRPAVAQSLPTPADNPFEHSNA